MNTNRKILVSALSLFLVISIPSPGHTLSVASNAQVSEVKISAGLKDDYLNKICKSNLLNELFYESYNNYIQSTWTGTYVSEKWNRFYQDGISLQNNNKSINKWLKKNKSKFNKSVRKSVDNLIKSNNDENAILVAMFNSKSVDGVQYEYDNFYRNGIIIGDASGKIRKSLKLPTREGNAGCP